MPVVSESICVLYAPPFVSLPSTSLRSGVLGWFGTSTEPEPAVTELIEVNLDEETLSQKKKNRSLSPR